MDTKLKTLIDNYGSEPGLTDVARFFSLLFNPHETVQFKEVKTVHPADALYVETENIGECLPSMLGRHSPDGYRFCCNPVPSAFTEKLEEVYRYEQVGKRQWDALAQGLRQELSLSSELFPFGRTMFIEADKDADGNPIDTVNARQAALRAIFDTGLPISFITDTGGNAPHVGIVLAEDLSLGEFRETVKLVLSRLPPWIDTAVGKVNQLGRVPGTLRTNKKGEVVPVTLRYLSDRTSKGAIDDWVKTNPVQNPKVLERATNCHGDQNYSNYGDTDAEEAAWRFIEERGLRHSRVVQNGKIQVSCPNTEAHKHGDRHLSAFVSVEIGIVWCSACQKTVGRTFTKPWGASPQLRGILDDLARKTELGRGVMKRRF